MRNTFSIIFYINRSKEKNGKVPVMGRVSLNGTTAYFSCRCSIKESLWSVSENRAIGKTQDAAQVNYCIDTLRARIIYSYNKLLISGITPLTARILKEDFMGMGNDYTTLLSQMKSDLENFAKRVEKDRSVKTFHKMKIVYKHTAKFIKQKYHTADIYLQEIKPEFIAEFSNWLHNNKHLSQSTIWVYTTYLKKILTESHIQGVIKRNPFHNFRISPNVKQREFLTEEEIKSLLNHTLSKPRLNHTKEIFLFGCLTGISYIDIKNLRICNIKVIKGRTWILSRRQKNKKPFQVQLLKIPEQILWKAVGKKRNPDTPVFKMASYECTNRDLKIIAAECGINKHLTFHLSRHTFATVALTNGMPIESVSHILGHSSITTTQIYAKILNSKLGNDITNFEQNLDAVLRK